jgi:hypothetical protein
LYNLESAISTASPNSGTRTRGAYALSTVAHAKLVAECPDGKECVVVGGPSW